MCTAMQLPASGYLHDDPCDARKGANASHLIALILRSKCMAESEPCGRERGVDGGRLAKVAPRVLIPADAQVVAGHAKPGNCPIWILLHQPAIMCEFHDILN